MAEWMSLDTLNNVRDELIARISDLQSEIDDLENELDRAQVRLHETDLQIKNRYANLRKAEPEKDGNETR